MAERLGLRLGLSWPSRLIPASTVPTNARITEEDEVRITEDGETRIQEES